MSRVDALRSELAERPADRHYREPPKGLPRGCRWKSRMLRESCEDCGQDPCRCLPEGEASLFDLIEED